MTVKDLKVLVEKQWSVEPSKQRLLYNNVELKVQEDAFPDHYRCTMVIL